MRKLDHITVRGFKSIRGGNLSLNPLNVLIGANGVGKSNFISLFRLLNRMVDKNLQTFVGQSGGADTLLYFGQKNTTEIVIELKFGLNGYKCKLVPTVEDEIIFAEEVSLYQRPDYEAPWTDHLGSGHRESKLEERARHQAVSMHVLESLRGWKVYHFHDTSESAQLKKKGDINDNAALRPDAANLAAFLYLLREKHAEDYERIVEAIRLVAPFFDDFNLRPDPHNPDFIRLEWREKGSDTYFRASSLSDGTLRFICLTTLLLQPSMPSAILIDEPELGLHPYAINVLAEMLQGAALKTQVIISTQSVPLVDQFSPGDVIVVNREDRQSTFERVDADKLSGWLQEYSLGELWVKNVIGGRP
jgi:predicted ATPase